jgi:copper resistance protein B
MKAWIIAFSMLVSPTALAQAQDEHAHHVMHEAAPTNIDVPPTCQPSEHEHCPDPAKVPPVTDAMRQAAFPDLGGMRMADHMHADPLLAGVVVDRLERHTADPYAGVAWDLRAWIGHDANRLWLRTEGDHDDGRTYGDASLLWGHAAAPWWDVLVGLRQDFGTDRDHTWAAVGVQGLAPYKVEIAVTAFVDHAGATALRVEAEYALLLTQRWVLQPRLETNLYSRADRLRPGAAGPDAPGLDDFQAGLRLRYEIRREIAPYLGIERQQQFGPGGRTRGDTRWVAGLRVAF